MSIHRKKILNPAQVSLPFPLVVIENKKRKKKCCKKYKKGKRCGSCPND